MQKSSLALTALSANVPCASWPMNRRTRNKIRVLLGEHFLARVWQAESRFSQDPM
jgi:hypothetical protein